MELRSSLRLGIGSYTFAWAIGFPGSPAPSRPLNAIGLIHKAVELGVDLVQICDNLPLHTLESSELQALAEAAAAASVAVEIGTRGTDPDLLRAYLHIAGLLKAPLVRTLVTESLDRAEKDLRLVSPAFESAEVRLALENYEAYACGELAALIRRIRSPCIGVCLDTANSIGALEPPDSVVETLLPLAFSLHIKDFVFLRESNRLGFRVIGAPAGQGLLKLELLFSKLKQNGYAGSLVIELWTPFTDDIERTARLEAEWAKRSVENLRKYFPGAGTRP